MTINLKLDHPYLVREADAMGDPMLRDPSKITEFLLISAINKKYGAEIKDVTMKSVGRFRNALTRAVKAGCTTLDVSEDTFDMIWSVAKDHAPNPHHAGWWIDLYDYLEGVKDSLKKTG